MNFFDKLGARVDELWQVADYDEERFPQIALQALEELPPHKHTSPLDVVAWATRQSHLPSQTDLAAIFGDPPLTVFAGRNFRIEILYWLRGAPEVHQHAFSGAFHVFDGSSIHTRWNFIPEERVDMRVLLGRVEFTEAEILEKGDNRAIIAGAAMFHATYHMEKPSVTVVIRTPHEADKSPQYSLMPPGVAYAPFDRQETVVRQSQLLRMLLQIRPYDFLDEARQLLARKDAYWMYEVLNGLWHSLDDEDMRQELVCAARLRNPRAVAAICSALERAAGDDRILNVRLGVGMDRDLRYLLALLRNVPDGEDICRLITLRYPGRDPVDLIEGWLRQLHAKGVLGFDLQECWFQALRWLLRGQSEEQILAHFRAADASLSAPRTTAEVRELCTALTNSWLLRTLFMRSRVRVAQPLVRVA